MTKQSSTTTSATASSARQSQVCFPHEATPNLEINMLFCQVRDDVLAATGEKQEPYVYGSLPGENFYFVRR